VAVALGLVYWLAPCDQDLARQDGDDPLVYAIRIQAA